MISKQPQFVVRWQYLKESRHLPRPKCCFFTPQRYLHHICISLRTGPQPHQPEKMRVFPEWLSQTSILFIYLFCINNRHFRLSAKEITSPTMAPETQQHFTEFYYDKATGPSPSGDNPCIWDLCSPHPCVQQLQSSLSSPQEARMRL